MILTPKMNHTEKDDSEEEDDSMTAGTVSDDENEVYLLNQIEYNQEG